MFPGERHPTTASLHRRRGPVEARGITTAIIAAAATAAVASAGATAYSASQQGAAAKRLAKGQGLINTKRIHPPTYMEGLQRYVAQVLASNVKSVPPSFGEYVQSGGTATFPLSNIDLNPADALRLGLVGKGNEPVPGFDPTQQSQLTPDQLMFTLQQGGRTADLLGPGAHRYQRLGTRETNLQNLLDSGNLGPARSLRVEQKLGKVKGRREQLKTKLFGGG